MTPSLSDLRKKRHPFPSPISSPSFPALHKCFPFETSPLLKGLLEKGPLLHLGKHCLVTPKRSHSSDLWCRPKRPKPEPLLTGPASTLLYLNPDPSTMAQNGSLHQVQTGSGRLAGKVAIVTGNHPDPPSLPPSLNTSHPFPHLPNQPIPTSHPY
jgi:hypothetical protein